MDRIEIFLFLYTHMIRYIYCNRFNLLNRVRGVRVRRAGRDICSELRSHLEIRSAMLSR